MLRKRFYKSKFGSFHYSENKTFWYKTVETKHLVQDILEQTFLWKIQIFSITVHVNISYELTNLCVDTFKMHCILRYLEYRLKEFEDKTWRYLVIYFCNVIGIRYTWFDVISGYTCLMIHCYAMFGLYSIIVILHVKSTLRLFRKTGLGVWQKWYQSNCL